MKQLAMTALAMAALLVGTSAFCAQDDVVASAGRVTVTRDEVTAMLDSLAPDARTHLAADPARLDQLVRARLAQKVMFDEAKAKGWDQQPQVKRAVERAQRDAVADSYLASVARPPADYPSDQDIQSAYDENKAAFTVPYSLHVAQIFVPVQKSASADALADARKKADALAKSARAPGADFAALAMVGSQDKASAANGGDMGFVPQTMLLPEVAKALGTMKPGDVSPVIQTAMGFHVVKLIETRPASERPLTEVREEIRMALRQQRTRAYLAKAVGPDTALINEDAVRRALGAPQ
jgi:parvulin-like peptidyl-prolyl isomerase